ncbi:hypothetical protein [Micromonospora sp. NBC_00858]|uniref:hypothetical protein n=1 Tax=Micromonospora sp. NBC_00858 TaxID=2975979 RepID=UPI00386D7922|nr:hypothetical protein OG990_05300 [Micromonospora sp. NBC_00858]
MQPYTLGEVDRWLDWIHEAHDEFDYRYIYFAYLAASSGQPGGGETTLSSNPDGSYLLRAGRDDRGLRLGNDDERREFTTHLRQRYCGDRYESMSEWEAAQHAGYLEDQRAWRSGW